MTIPNGSNIESAVKMCQMEFETIAPSLPACQVVASIGAMKNNSVSYLCAFRFFCVFCVCFVNAATQLLAGALVFAICAVTCR